jgi:hypothetical protein
MFSDGHLGVIDDNQSIVQSLIWVDAHFDSVFPARRRREEHDLRCRLPLKEAFADSVASLRGAWKGGAGDREVARVSNTGDARADAYADAVADLQSAWMRGKGR